MSSPCLILTFVDLNFSLFNLCSWEIFYRHSNNIPSTWNFPSKSLVSFSQILGCSLNFQPAVELFQRNTFDYGISECERILKYHYPVENLFKHKRNLTCGNSSKRSGTYYAVLDFYLHYQTEVPSNTDEHVITWR